MEIKTLQDLKDFLGTLNEQQLQTEATVALEDDFTRITSADVLEEDYFYNVDSEGSMPVSTYDPDDWDGIPLEDDYNSIIPKGTPRLFDDTWDK